MLLNKKSHSVFLSFAMGFFFALNFFTLPVLQIRLVLLPVSVKHVQILLCHLIQQGHHRDLVRYVSHSFFRPYNYIHQNNYEQFLLILSLIHI